MFLGGQSLSTIGEDAMKRQAAKTKWAKAMTTDEKIAILCKCIQVGSHKSSEKNLTAFIC